MKKFSIILVRELISSIGQNRNIRAIEERKKISE